MDGETSSPVEETTGTESSSATEDGQSGQAEQAETPDRIIARARELAEDGDLDAALKLVFNKPSDAFKLSSEKWKAFRTKAKSERAEIARMKAEVEGYSREELGKLQAMKQQLSPLEEARKAYEAGDYDRAHDLAFGETVNDFQAKAFQKKLGGDPEVAKLRREIEESKKVAAEREQALQRQTQEHATSLHLQEMSAALMSSGDPVLAKLSKLPAFRNQVLDIQKKTWDGTSFMDHTTAAKRAFALAPQPGGPTWADLFEGLQPAASAQQKAPQKTASLPQRSGDVERTRELSSQEIIEKYAKLLRSQRDDA